MNEKISLSILISKINIIQFLLEENKYTSSRVRYKYLWVKKEPNNMAYRFFFNIVTSYKNTFFVNSYTFEAKKLTGRPITPKIHI